MASCADPDNIKDNRHCAYCLKSISGEEVKRCGKCRRRAYCSKECQVKDWKLGPTTASGIYQQRGQGHKGWCSLRCGEEDLDWEVAPVEGKGLGLVALKHIPPRTRIMVEAAQLKPDLHPGINELEPIGGSIQEKWDLNCFQTSSGEPVLCVRMARANHACKPNAGHFYYEANETMILYAERDIAAGEEITITYVPEFADPSGEDSTGDVQEISQQVLKIKWGITCPEDCFCQDLDVLKDTKKAYELYTDVCNLIHKVDGETIERGSKLVKELLVLQEGRLSSTQTRCKTLRAAFLLGVMSEKTLAEALGYLNTLVGIMTDIAPPTSEDLKLYKGFKDHPETHPFYLLQK